MNGNYIPQYEYNAQFELTQTQLPVSEANPPQLPISEEIRKMMGNTKLAKAMQTIKLQSFLSGKTCPTVEVNNIGDILALTNSGGIVSNKTTFSFNNETTKFGIYNCETYHICHLLHIFIELKELGNVVIKGITGSTIAA